jgi:WS/DGAT/MGAT family acyltransferase
VRQLSGLDSTFLHLDGDTQYGHIAGLSVFAKPEDEDYEPREAWRNQLSQRIGQLDPLRRRLRRVPFGLDHPFWVDDPEFDLDFHVRAEHLVHGDDDELRALIAELITKPLDLRRPLWESYAIDGLSGDRFAILTKLHHATVDGAAGVELLTLMLDEQPGPVPAMAPADGWSAKPMPNDLEVLAAAAGSMLRKPIKAAFLAAQLTQAVASSVRNPVLHSAAGQVVTGLRSVATRRPVEVSGPLPRLRAPATPFNGPLTSRREFAFGSASLAMIKGIKAHFGVSVNDIVLAACAGGLRTWLDEREALPAEPLIAVVPIASKASKKDRWSNRVSVAVASLPTDEAERADRVAKVHEAMNEAKGWFEAVPADALTDFAEFPPPAVFAVAMRAAARFGRARRMPVNIAISNVPGPRQPLYSAGARLLHYYPVSTIMEGTGLNITVHSYQDSLDFGLVACPDLVPDVGDVLDDVLDELVALAADAGMAADSVTRGSPPSERGEGRPSTKSYT